MIKIFIKYPKIRILGDRSNEGILTSPGKIVITEKVDGGNFGFYIEDNILHFCSHNQNLTDSEQIEKTGIPKNWKAIEPVMKSWENDPTQFDESLYYYGESLQKHTMKYNDDIPGFIGFDIFDMRYDEFISYEFIKPIFEKMGLKFINVICELETNKEITIDYLKSLYQKSAYKEGSAEGIVIKNYDKQLFAKIVDDKFKEQNRKVFGHGEIKKSTNEDKIVETYATSGRIEKIIHKLHDENYIIAMPMMKILFNKVVEDILTEEIIEIYHTYSMIDFKLLNKLVSKKCAPILKDVIMNE